MQDSRRESSRLRQAFRTAWSMNRFRAVCQRRKQKQCMQSQHRLHVSRRKLVRIYGIEMQTDCTKRNIPVREQFFHCPPQLAAGAENRCDSIVMQKTSAPTKTFST